MQKNTTNDNPDGLSKLKFLPNGAKVGRICPACPCAIYYNNIIYTGNVDENGTPVGGWFMKISITQQKPVEFVVNQEDDELHTFTGFVDSKTNALILGCYKYKDIYIYKGEWKDGKKNGMGEMVFLPKDSSNINEELIHNSFLNYNNENLILLFEDKAYRYDEIYGLKDTEKMEKIRSIDTRFTEGVKYVGDFKNNQMDGKGILSYDNKPIYDGQWCQFHKHGKGMLYNQQGKEVYNGGWLWNGKHGYGIEYFYTDGNEKVYERYEGEFCGGLRDNGTMYLTNGNTFTGDFVKGGISSGVLNTKEGSSYTGRVYECKNGNWEVKDYQGEQLYKTTESLQTLQPVSINQKNAILSQRGSGAIKPIKNCRSTSEIAKPTFQVENLNSTLKIAQQTTQKNCKPIPQFRIKPIKNCRSTSEIAKLTFQVENLNSTLKIAQQTNQIKSQTGSIERSRNTELSAKPAHEVASKTLKISRTQIQIRDGSIDNKSKISSLTHYFTKPPLNPSKKDIKCFRCN